MHIRITKTRVAMAALFVLAGVGLGSLLSPLVGTALATAGQIVNISDRSGAAFFAKVSADGKLAVGDGSGPLSVDGTVAGRPAAPATPWRASERSQLPSKPLPARPCHRSTSQACPSRPMRTGSDLHIFLLAGHVPSSATSCTGATNDGTLWQIRDAGDGITPVSFAFPTPLQWKPPANTKACLLASPTRMASTHHKRRGLLRRLTAKRTGALGRCALARQVLPPALGRDLPAQRLQLRTHLRDHG